MTHASGLSGCSERLDSEAIVEFVKALCAIASEELRPASPRVYSLTKIVEIAHFNMNRIRSACWHGVRHAHSSHADSALENGSDSAPSMHMVSGSHLVLKQ